ncbi:MAG: hypothetical protein HY954_02605 [Deltaproteobacteria bacterium]|nr:hypothetical protein [Deltaproteobacteria bacterium]
MYYNAAKLMHIFGLITWLGPSTGGYLLFLLARYEKESGTVIWIFDKYINLVYLEGLGLLILLLSGYMMRDAEPELRHAHWLKRKLLIVFLIFVPFELAHLYLYNFIVKEVFFKGIGITETLLFYDKLAIAATFALLVAVPAVFWLSIFRPRSLVRD